MSCRILALNAFHGGSHRAFLDGWSQRSRHEFKTLSLPGTKWKWRARHSAVWFAEQLRTASEQASGKRSDSPARPGVTSLSDSDILFCTDMLNLAEFLGLAPEPIRRLPRVVYFHENQFTYPNRGHNDRDLHLAYSNITTALAADAVWFNSEFHRREFLAAARDFLRRMPDRRQLELVDRIERKSEVQSPGVWLIPRSPDRSQSPGPLRIVWVSRWEHDKRPDTFFAALRMLIDRGVHFRVSVLGESYRNSPSCFDVARGWLGERVDHWGFAETRDDYEAVLRSSDVVVSTAEHEFFGIAVLEAVSAGCVPFVPRALAYPETLGADHQWFHDNSPEDLARQLEQAVMTIADRTGEPPTLDVSRFGWPRRAVDMDDRIERLRPQSFRP